MLKKRLSKLRITFIFLIVVLAAYVGYRTYIRGTFDKTTYTNYRNNYYKYSIDYPDNWVLHYHPSEDPLTTPYMRILSPCGDEEVKNSSCAEIAIRARKGDNGPLCSPLGIKNDYCSLHNVDTNSISGAGEIEVGENTGYAFLESGNPVFKTFDEYPVYNMYYVLLNNNDVVYNISYWEAGDEVKSPNDWNYKNEAEKVVNSFSYLE